MTVGTPRAAEDGSDEIVEPASDREAADSTAEDVFGGEDNARAVAGLIADFVASWERYKHEKAPETWLAEELRRSSGIRFSEEEALSTAREIVAAVERADADKVSLYAHLDAGRSKASWLAGTIERGAAAAGARAVGDYAAKIDEALRNANAEMLETVSAQGGTGINMNPNLDGFIAERHHVDTFNLDAAAKNSPLRAKVLEPGPGKPFGKNSLDIGIYDGNDPRPKRRYQAKYGKDAKATERLFKEGDNRGQRKLVPPEQKSDLPGSTDAIEKDGVRSEPLSKDRAKAMREQVQRDGEARKYGWNDVNRIEIAKSIGKQAAQAAALAVAFQGARVLVRRVWNVLHGNENPPPSEDLRDFFESSVRSAGHVGAQAAVSGAVVVAARSGLIRGLQATPPGRIAGFVHVAMENARVLFKFARGELNGEEALDAMGNSTCAAVGGLVGAVKGAALGAALGPVGAFIGGVVGGMAGSKIGEAVYEGGKAIIKTAAKVVRTVFEGAVETVAKVVRVLNPLNRFA